MEQSAEMSNIHQELAETSKKIKQALKVAKVGKKLAASQLDDGFDDFYQ